MDQKFWQGKRVLVTGHTGFKGAWLSLWLQSLGAELSGFALAPPTDPSLFETAAVAEGMTGVEGDVRDLAALIEAMERARPEIVFHLAAQSLVHRSYRDPVETYTTNVTGTVHLLEAVRRTGGVRVVVVVTSDKCYENREWLWPYREDEALGGHDPYSSSKACAELVTDAYRRSFFDGDAAGPVVGSVRAGNVIGGGDWADDRLIPDIVRAFLDGRPVRIRNPAATRPWQHVLEPLGGYLLLADRLWHQGREFAAAWNFGPRDQEVRPVSWIVERLAQLWGEGASFKLDGDARGHEAHQLRLDSSRAHELLGWSPRIGLDVALQWVVEWYRQFQRGGDVRAITLDEIGKYGRLE